MGQIEYNYHYTSIVHESTEAVTMVYINVYMSNNTPQLQLILIEIVFI